MTVLSDDDRALVESVPFDPDAAVAFNEITACLVWADEIPDGLSRAGYEVIRDLLVARGLIHRGIPVEEWDYGWTERWERWNDAIGSGLRWNGYRRLALTGEQRALLGRYLRSELEL
jgi:hypothetical protein